MKILVFILLIIFSSYAQPKIGITKGTEWYWQLEVDKRYPLKRVDAQLYDIDLFDTTKKTIDKLKNDGKIVICYFSAGTFEEWREDFHTFTEGLLGKKLEKWAGERWLNIKDKRVRKIMLKRLNLAKQKGCDGVEPDNVDAYENDTGFLLTYKDQLDYNKFLAKEAHKRGLLIALKNDPVQVHELVDYFDFVVSEQCFEYDECELYAPFLKQNKAVLNVEYRKKGKRKICKKSKELGISTIFLNEELNGKYYDTCR